MATDDEILQRLIAEGFSDDEILKEMSAPPAPKAKPDNAGLVTRALRGIGALDQDDTAGARMKRGLDVVRGPLQKAFPKGGSDPLEDLSAPNSGAPDVLATVLGGAAGKLIGAGGKALLGSGRAAGAATSIAQGAGENAAAAQTSGGDPLSAAALGAAFRLPQAAGAAARATQKALAESPKPRGRDIRVQEEMGVEPRTFREYSDPQGNMPDPKKFAPTDSGRGMLGEEVSTEVHRRANKAEANVKAELDARSRRNMPREGAETIDMTLPIAEARTRMGEKTFGPGTKQNLEALSSDISTGVGSKVNVSSSVEQAMRRERVAKDLIRRAKKKGGDPSDRALAEQMLEESDRLRGEARLANQEGPYSEIPYTTVKEAREVRTRAKGLADLGKQGKMDLDELPFAELQANINKAMDASGKSPRLRAADRRYNQHMGEAGRIGPDGEEIYSGIEGFRALERATKEDTRGSRVAGVGQDTISAGARERSSQTLKNIAETHVDPLAGLPEGAKSSRFLLTQPELLLARQRQSWFGPKPAKLPGAEGGGGIGRQLLNTVTGFGEPMLNRGIYPNAKRLADLLDPGDVIPGKPARPNRVLDALFPATKQRPGGPPLRDLGDPERAVDLTARSGTPKGALDVLPGILVGKDAKDKKRKREEARKRALADEAQAED